MQLFYWINSLKQAEIKLVYLLIITGVVLLLSCSFLYSTPFLNGNLFIKQFGVEVLIGIISTVCWFGFILKQERWEINLTAIDLIIIVLLLLYAIDLLAFNYSLIRHSLPYYYGMFYFSVSLGLRTFINKFHFKFKNGLLVFAPLVVILHAIIFFLQQTKVFPSLHGFFSNGGTFGNPDMLGSYIAVLLPFCLMQKQNYRKTGYLAFLTGIMLLIFVQARSALLAVIACGILWLIINKRMTKKIIPIIIFLSVSLAGLLIMWYPESVYGRFFIWFISLKMIYAKPLGWGIFAFEKYYPEFQASYVASNQYLPYFISPDMVHSPFNEFLNVGVTLGSFGLFLLIALVSLVLYQAGKSKSPLVYPLVIFTVISLFYFPFKIAPLLGIVIPLVAFVSVKSHVVSQMRIPKTIFKGIFLVLLLSSLFLTCASIANYGNHKLWQKAVLFSRNNEMAHSSEKLFTELYPVMKENGRFLISYSNLKYKQGFTLTALELLEEADNYFCDIVLSLKLARLYEVTGDYIKAGKFYTLAENIAPDRFLASYEKVLFLINIGKDEEAYLLSKEIMNRPIKKTSYADPYIIKSRLSKFIHEYEDI